MHWCLLSHQGWHGSTSQVSYSLKQNVIRFDAHDLRTEVGKQLKLSPNREANGTVAVLIVGGASEALNRDDKEIRLVLNRRKGFIKLALRFGRDLVPVFSFGENFIYGQVPNPEGSMLRRFQDWFERNFAFSPPIFYGRGIFQYSIGIVPYRKPINVVVGKPIKVEQIEHPTSEDIERMHAKYVEALVQLYEEYNPKYGNPDVKLIVA